MAPTTREPDPQVAAPYDGDVTPGGPVQVRELPGLTIRKLAVSAMSNNVYLLTDTATGEQLLIDAADDPEQVLQLVASGTGRLDWVVTTHQHWDHHRALAAVVEATGARTAAGADDADALPVRPDRRLAQGDTLQVGDVSLEVVHLRGHTPGRSPSPTRTATVARTSSPGTRSSPEGSATPRTRVRASTTSSPTSPSGSSTSTTTTRGSTPATGATPCSAGSAPTCRSGANAAGDSPAHPDGDPAQLSRVIVTSTNMSVSVPPV